MTVVTILKLDDRGPDFLQVPEDATVNGLFLQRPSISVPKPRAKWRPPARRATSARRLVSSDWPTTVSLRRPRRGRFQSRYALLPPPPAQPRPSSTSSACSTPFPETRFTPKSCPEKSEAVHGQLNAALDTDESDATS